MITQELSIAPLRSYVAPVYPGQTQQFVASGTVSGNPSVHYSQVTATAFVRDAQGFTRATVSAPVSMGADGVGNWTLTWSGLNQLASGEYMTTYQASATRGDGSRVESAPVQGLLLEPPSSGGGGSDDDDQDVLVIDPESDYTSPLDPGQGEVAVFSGTVLADPVAGCQDVVCTVVLYDRSGNLVSSTSTPVTLGPDGTGRFRLVLDDFLPPGDYAPFFFATATRANGLMITTRFEQRCSSVSIEIHVISKGYPPVPLGDPPLFPPPGPDDQRQGVPGPVVVPGVQPPDGGPEPKPRDPTPQPGGLGGPTPGFGTGSEPKSCRVGLRSRQVQ